MNSVVLTGRCVADPELKSTTTGKQVCSFTIAVDRRFKVENQPTADFINCVAWGKTAEFIAKWFTKGKMIALNGNIQTRTWEDNEGKKKYSTEIIVDNVEFCGDKSSSETTTTSKPSPQSTSQFKEVQETNDSEDDLPF